MDVPTQSNITWGSLEEPRATWTRGYSYSQDTRKQHEGLAFQRKLNQMATRRDATVHWTIPSCPGCPTTTPRAIWRRRIAQIPPAREQPRRAKPLVSNGAIWVVGTLRVVTHERGGIKKQGQEGEVVHRFFRNHKV